jgi:FdhD protein
VNSGPRCVDLARWRDGQSSVDTDVVVEECAIAFSYNGVAHAVMMATPSDLEDYALGFSLHEGIVAAADELRFIEALRRDDGVVLDIAIPQHRSEALASRQRRTLGSSACGWCGSEALRDAVRPMPKVVAADIDAASIARALSRFPGLQALNAVTGGVHAAAWCSGDEIRMLREDVGRHNAFDKLVGALLRAGIGACDGYAIVSSRASYELVHKAATSGIGTLVAMSAPTSAAIDGAKRCGLRLIGFARDGAMNVYTGLESMEHEP